MNKDFKELNLNIFINFDIDQICLSSYTYT